MANATVRPATCALANGAPNIASPLVAARNTSASVVPAVTKTLSAGGAMANHSAPGSRTTVLRVADVSTPTARFVRAAKTRSTTGNMRARPPLRKPFHAALTRSVMVSRSGDLSPDPEGDWGTALELSSFFAAWQLRNRPLAFDVRLAKHPVARRHHVLHAAPLQVRYHHAIAHLLGDFKCRAFKGGAAW